MTRKRTSSHARKPLKTRLALHSHKILSSQLRMRSVVSAENFLSTGTEPSPLHRIRRTKFHRRDPIETRQRAQKRPRNASIFNRLQRGVQLIETTRYQTACFQTHAHSSSVSPVFATLTQNTPGVCIPPRQLAAAKPPNAGGEGGSTRSATTSRFEARIASRYDTRYLSVRPGSPARYFAPQEFGSIDRRIGSFFPPAGERVHAERANLHARRDRERVCKDLKCLWPSPSRATIRCG